MSNLKFVNIAKLLTTYHLEIKSLPESLKCITCKLVVKDAYQVPCGCTFCRICIDDMIRSKNEFCPGSSQECGETLLSTAIPDYKANKNISKLIVKCPQNGCLYECQLSTIEDHMQVCLQKSVDCPFHEFGCQQDQLPSEEMNNHLQQANMCHNQILIEMIANLRMEMNVNKREIELLKSELILKDDQMKTIIEEVRHVENENKFIRNQMKSIVEEKNIADQVRVLSEKIEQEGKERLENFDLANARITVITGAIGSNRDELKTEMKSLRDDIGTINQVIQSIKDDIDSLKMQTQPKQVPEKPIQAIASYDDWIIDRNLESMSWSNNSDYFFGLTSPYKFQLVLSNSVNTLVLNIRLNICSGLHDSVITWPFHGSITISVTDKSKPEKCQITHQCQVEKPPDNFYRCSDPFIFQHSELVKAGVNLRLGVRVSCQIVPDVRSRPFFTRTHSQSMKSSRPH